MAIGLLSIVWQVFLERTFADEIFAKARMSENIKISGISEINDNFKKIEWADLLDSARYIDLFFIWAQTWTNTYRDELKSVSKKKDVKIRLILPDPNNEQTLKSLMDRMKLFDSEYIKTKILETKRTYEEIFNENAHLEIWLIKKPLLFSIYRFDNKIIFALSSHRTDKPSVPTFKFREGPIYKFLHDEISFLTESEYSTKVYDNKKK